ncbi:MAG: HlyD family secretion protein, partial [Nitrobacter sp.]
MTDTSYVADLKAKNIFRPSRKVIRRGSLAIVAALGVAGTVHFGHQYWTVGRYLESTDDAYVKADSTIISPRVSGYIAKVLVSDNQTV